MRTQAGMLLILTACVLVSSCGKTSTVSLDRRCYSLYRTINSIVSQAEAEMSGGLPQSQASLAALESLNELLQEKEALRQDLADGGEKHKWEWPTTIRKDVYNKFDLISNGDELTDVRKFAESEFGGLMWFCNRASSARMPPLEPSNNLIRRVEEGAMKGAILEILAEARTKEEADAILQYMMKVGLAR